MSLSKINLVVIGHKDHGKSTLIGRLLYDSNAIPEQKLQEVEAELRKAGDESFRFAFLLDTLEEERRGGLTIDIMHTPFQTKKQLYTIIDCPGHKEFIKKMLTGASQADAAILVASAKEGIQDQTRQHAFLVKTLGIDQLVIAINKMDQVGYEETVFTGMCQSLDEILLPMGFKNVPKVPISALNGDNVFTESNKMNWYNGSTLINTLDETVRPPQPLSEKSLRACVQDVYRRGNEVTLVCKVETGVLETGRTVCLSPSGKRGAIRSIEIFGTKQKEAKPGDSVGLLIGGVEHTQRGEVISYPENPAKSATSFTANIILFSDIEIRKEDSYKIRCGTAEKQCKVDEIIAEIDPVKLTVTTSSPEVLVGGSFGEVEFSPLEPMCIERHSDFPPLGRFVVEGKKGTAGAGIVLEVTQRDSRVA